MANDSAKPKVFLVLGVKASGSGSLTYPEDFELEEVWLDEEKAKDRARELNKKSVEDYGLDIGDFDDFDYLDDMFEFGADDYMRYEVYPLPVRS